MTNTRRSIEGTDLEALLRQAIRDSGLNRFTVSKKAGLPYSIVHAFMAGKRGMTLVSATRIIEALGLTVALRRTRRKG